MVDTYLIILGIAASFCGYLGVRWVKATKYHYRHIRSISEMQKFVKENDELTVKQVLS